MAKDKDQKVLAVSDYKKWIKSASAVILVDSTGISANDANEFKKQLMGLGSRFNVVKNTLFKIALSESELPELETLDSGSHSALFVEKDIAGAAKLLKELIKRYKDTITIKAGLMDGQLLSIEQVTELAEMPSRDQSIAMIAGLLTKPMADVANVLEDSVRSVAIIINQAFKE